MYDLVNLKLIRRIKIVGDAPTVSHLLFVDDLIISKEVCMSEVFIIKTLLTHFSLLLDQVVNYTKSTMYFSSNCSAKLCHQLTSFMGVKLMTLIWVQSLEGVMLLKQLLILLFFDLNVIFLAGMVSFCHAQNKPL